MLKRLPRFFMLTKIACLALLTASPASAGDYAVHHGTLRLTYDPVTIVGDETLGLLGFHALIHQGDYAYLGLSGFGAVSGERGGFLTGGYSGGIRLPLTRRLTADLALFLGAGGGGSAPQGGGLMAREQVGIDYHAVGYRVGGGISRVHFPNGGIDSVQHYFAFQIPFTTIYASGWEAGTLTPEGFSAPLYDHPSSFALSFKQYRGSELFRSTPQPSTSISLVGFEWQQLGYGPGYLSLAAHGAFSGGADGYAEAMAGGGLRWQLTAQTRLGAALALGSGGGGNVDTGGGVLGSAMLQLEQRLVDNLYLTLQGGYAGALEGGFGGTVTGLTLGTHYTSAATSGWGDQPATLPYGPSRYRLRLIQQRYLPEVARVNGTAQENGAIELTGLQLDKPLGNHFYLTGQAMAARQGGAGGYASGMVGGGLSLPLTRHVAVAGELLAGGAGGGGIDVGDGLLLGGTLMATFHLSDALDLEMGSGRIAAHDGGLDARQLTLAVAYRFTRPER